MVRERGRNRRKQIPEKEISQGKEKGRCVGVWGNHKGRRKDGVWVFGGIERDSKNCFF